ncbi:MAG: nuclear transport factor 2 family protein [Pseudomonadota bacterium]
MKISKITLPILMVAASTSFASAQDTALFDEIMRAYEGINTAFEQDDTATIETLVTPDHVSISPYYGGALDLEEQLAVDGQLSIAQSPVGEITVSPLSDDVVLLQFVSERSGSFAGEPLSERAYVTIVWVRENGVWLERMYQETPVP